MPFSTRPHRPLRWSALLLEIGDMGKDVVLVLGEYWGILARPVSITYLMPGMVRDVSAILVAMMIFLPDIEAKTFCWIFSRKPRKQWEYGDMGIAPAFNQFPCLQNILFRGHEDKDISPAFGVLQIIYRIHCLFHI